MKSKEVNSYGRIPVRVALTESIQNPMARIKGVGRRLMSDLALDEHQILQY